MIAHQNIRMTWLNIDLPHLNFVKASFKEDANEQRSPPKEKRMKWFRLNHDNETANLDAKFWLIISWFSSRMIISEGLYFLKNALPIAGR